MSEREYRLGAGDRVVVLAAPFYRVTGQLVRPARFLGKRAWLVELDSPNAGRFAIRRTRIVETALAPVDRAAGAINPTTRRISSARAAFALALPFASSVWIFLPGPAALVVDVLIAVAAFVGYRSSYADAEVRPPVSPSPPPMPQVTPGRYWCEHLGCRMYRVSTNIDTCVECGHPTMTQRGPRPLPFSRVSAKGARRLAAALRRVGHAERSDR